ncbi:sarcosine dehydrogenase, mitochondrial isoform X1 [Leopardus geoffroyi]|uniref:sarcosine dehydrogenase, mitochondrial isoform X1 n=1 Tax=Leopardus geoffroyi TaxID=46844 RepID=UPI001E26097D|nr:sarcosine dehydrogenase, mitochondrial isoform X1 [Leopardus geoffroyi]XP_045326227.1 sarcosine dehydrogenase, mitochondrial isoform X1 [Leopardus geoffroyi]XP_045326228.1 sarcosine dehydrogenase, mitochondrial isoform X1 [Leopardus geoffroyi]
MASLSRALRVAATCPRRSRTWGLGLRALTGRAGPTAEKSVPYRRTLKDPQGPSTVARGPSQPLPGTAHVVVIGGGSLGCQTLYHLAKLGVSGAVLLERERLTSGTTWHTAGLLWQLRPSDVEVELLAHTRRVVSHDLEEETGLHTGWIQNGGLFIASNRQRLDEYKRLMSLGKAYGVESHVLSPAETKALYPLMNVDDLYGTLYVPHDGTMDPAGTCTALTRAAAARGAQVIENCPVTGIRVRTDDFGVRRVAAVETEHGSIQTPCVVNCAGVWAGAVGRMAGVKVPLVAMHHAYVVTERIEGIQNMPNVRDHDASVYLRLQGDALSVGGYETNPIFWEEVSDKFAFGLFDLDWDVFTQHIEGAINRVPVLEKTGVKSTVCGPGVEQGGEATCEVQGTARTSRMPSVLMGRESFTPDHKPLMGEAPELRGFFLGCGFNSAGMMLGGGCGQELAHWIVHGRPEKDMYSYDIRRFHHLLTDHRRWIRERSHESYAKNYSVVFPHDEPLAGRNMRTDPLHEELLARGCVFQERQGWERPGWFTPKGTAPVLRYDYYGAYGNRMHEDHAYGRLLGDEYTFDFPPHHDVIKKECLACRGAAAVFNMSYFGKFYLVGLDARKAADWLFSADVSRPPGSTVYTCMLNHRGGTESDLTVSRLAPGPQASALAPAFEGDGYYLAVGGAVAQHNWSHISTVLQDQKFRCQLIDSSEDLGLISIQGPASRAILQEVLDADLSDEAFPFSTHKLVRAAGHLVRAMRLSFVGELGWELHVPKPACVAVYQAVMAAGTKHGLVNAGYRAIDSLSIEKGYRHWHADLRPDDSPLEAGLAFTCKLKSAVPFLGREALEKQRAEGLHRRLVCFTVDEKVPMFGLEAIWRNGQVVGHVRRADFGFAVDKTLAYGYIRDPSGQSVTLDFVKSGDYALERMGVAYPARAHLKSPFDPDNKRVKGIY